MVFSLRDAFRYFIVFGLAANEYEYSNNADFVVESTALSFKEFHMNILKN